MEFFSLSVVFATSNHGQVRIEDLILGTSPERKITKIKKDSRDILKEVLHGCAVGLGKIDVSVLGIL